MQLLSILNCNCCQYWNCCQYCNCNCCKYWNCDYYQYWTVTTVNTETVTAVDNFLKLTRLTLFIYLYSHLFVTSAFLSLPATWLSMMNWESFLQQFLPTWVLSLPDNFLTIQYFYYLLVINTFYFSFGIHFRSWMVNCQLLRVWWWYKYFILRHTFQNFDSFNYSYTLPTIVCFAVQYLAEQF